MSESTDEQLFSVFRDAGDERALSEIVERHWERSYRLALGVTGDPASAEDVAQEAFVQVVLAARSGKTLDPLGGWIVSVVLNGARKSLRGSKRRERHEGVARARRAEAATNDASDLDAYLEKLPTELASPVLLHYGLGLTHTETARALGCPVGTVATRLRTAIEKLRASVGAGLAIEPCLAELFQVARKSAVPKAPSVARILGRAGTPVAASTARRLALRIVPGVAVVATGALAIAFLSKGSDSPSSPTNAAGAASVASGSSDERNEKRDVTSSGAGNTNRVILTPPSTNPRGEIAHNDPALARYSLDETALGEPEVKVPAYPWHELSATERRKAAENQRALRDRKVTINFDQTTLDEVVAQWNDLRDAALVPPIALTSETKALAEEESLKVSLRVNAIDGANALNLIAATKEELAVEVDGSGARIAVQTAIDPLVAAARRVQVASLPSKKSKPAAPPSEASQRDWIAEMKRELAAAIDLDFTDAPLSDVVEKLQNATQLNITVSKSVDMETVKLTGRLRGAHLDEALGSFLRQANLRYSFRNETLFITDEPEPAPDPVWSRKLSVDLRGATARDLVKALAEKHVALIVSPEAWRSNATFSIVLADVSAEDAERAIAAQVPLEKRGRFTPASKAAPEGKDGDGAKEGEVPDAGILYAGSVPSAREALLVALPERAGVAAQVEALRTKLAVALVARTKARLAPASPVAELLEREKSVHHLSWSILEIVARAKALEGARARAEALPGKLLDEARGRLTDARRAVEIAGGSASSKQRCAVYGAEARVEELEHDMAEAKRDVELLEVIERGEALPEAR